MRPFVVYEKNNGMNAYIVLDKAVWTDNEGKPHVRYLLAQVASSKRLMKTVTGDELVREFRWKGIY